jgi:DNA-directed RNA polymerase-3 subunit RPC5
MTIKSSADSDEIVTETMADRLRGVQLEHWKKMDYADEDTEDAWLTYQQSLLLHTFDGVEKAGADAKGKQPEVQGEDAAGGGGEGTAGVSDLDERVPGLGTDWGEDELLRAVSGIKAHDRKPGEEAVTDRVAVDVKGKGKAVVKKTPAVKAEPEAEGPRGVGRPRKAAAAAAAPAAASRKSGRTRGTPMEVD